MERYTVQRWGEGSWWDERSGLTLRAAMQLHDVYAENWDVRIVPDELVPISQGGARESAVALGVGGSHDDDIRAKSQRKGR